MKYIITIPFILFSLISCEFTQKNVFKEEYEYSTEEMEKLAADIRFQMLIKIQTYVNQDISNMLEFGKTWGQIDEYIFSEQREAVLYWKRLKEDYVNKDLIELAKETYRFKGAEWFQENTPRSLHDDKIRFVNSSEYKSTSSARTESTCNMEGCPFPSFYSACHTGCSISQVSCIEQGGANEFCYNMAVSCSNGCCTSYCEPS